MVGMKEKTRNKRIQLRIFKMVKECIEKYKIKEIGRSFVDEVNTCEHER